MKILIEMDGDCVRAPVERGYERLGGLGRIADRSADGTTYGWVF